MIAYSREQWEQLDRCGRQLDRRLAPLRLTMGSEPTYVSATGAGQPEWTVAALGEEKAQRARELAERLGRRFAPGGIFQEGQGKWYPGEDLPRWALRHLWFEAPVARGPSQTDPQRFLQTLSRRLGVNEHHVRRCASEDALVLVLSHTTEKGWQSAPWAGEIELLQGPGPVGMRLPWSDLPDAHPARELGTALCVEPGLRVFLPPVSCGKAWWQLLSAVLDCCGDAELLGYAPPAPALEEEGLPGLKLLSVTPDPGVIEVNLQPSASWPELVGVFLGVDEEARQCGLVSHRFWKDGTLLGTGGGCHVVMGGATPVESPFARRPDLLRSILVYWNRHPSLSYLFAGLFVGPTSQAPRVDEARLDSHYELELAFRELDTQAAADPAVLGRIFRDLLVDGSGNGHRSEICVDKLFDPEAPGGQQGLLEFRALEMLPDPRMNLAVMLLFRALLARLTEQPESGPLRRFGTELHDRYMLPTFLWQDLEEVLHDLRQHGIELQPEWFRPHWEFRFPLLGSCRCAGVRLELRSALEPWPALGEAAQATSRPVDSSVQRVEAHLVGFDPTVHQLACNGYLVPLSPLGKREYLGAVRFRAWHYANVLHPTVGVHAPLQFDLVERSSGRSVGACRYHTARPDGEPWCDYPASAEEAEQRRSQRFEQGLSGKQREWKQPHPHPEYPLTLDLRRESLERPEFQAVSR